MTKSKHVNVVKPTQSVKSAPAKGLRWDPIIGPEVSALIGRSRVKDFERESVISYATSILGRGISPKVTESSQAGLVIGHVQSGKTFSFTTVIALAQDNDFQLIIVIAGSSVPLLDQSHNRLRDDLNINADGASSKWITFKNPNRKTGECMAELTNSK